jgi:hypothetical protein
MPSHTYVCEMLVGTTKHKAEMPQARFPCEAAEQFCEALIGLVRWEDGRVVKVRVRVDDKLEIECLVSVSVQTKVTHSFTAMESM